MRAASTLSLLVVLALIGCAKKDARGPQVQPAAVAAPRPELPTLLAFMPLSASAEATFAGLQSELGEDFNLVPSYLGADATPTQLAEQIERSRPAILLLMNNPTLRLYRSYQALPSARRDLPAVAVLASFLRETSGGINNLTGVIYEVPLLTSLVNLRVLLKQPLKRVGVILRPSFRSFLEEQRALAASEGFQLVGVEVAGADQREVKNALERLRSDEKVDAIWVLNDNVLLAPNVLTKGWLPGLRGNKIPVVVNVGSLLSKKVDFGTFAVLPDHRALGVQAAAMVSSVAERGWQTAGLGFEYPVSVETVLDLAFARKNLELAEDQLATVDRLLE